MLVLTIMDYPDHIILCINLDYVLSLPAEQPDSLKVPAGLYASGLSLVCVCVFLPVTCVWCTM